MSIYTDWTACSCRFELIPVVTQVIKTVHSIKNVGTNFNLHFTLLDTQLENEINIRTNDLYLSVSSDSSRILTSKIIALANRFIIFATKVTYLLWESFKSKQYINKISSKFSVVTVFEICFSTKALQSKLCFSMLTYKK